MAQLWDSDLGMDIIPEDDFYKLENISGKYTQIGNCLGEMIIL